MTGPFGGFTHVELVFQERLCFLDCVGNTAAPWSLSPSTSCLFEMGLSRFRSV